MNYHSSDILAIPKVQNTRSMYQNELCVFLDAGHGGLDSHGNYTTAPNKQYRHKNGNCQFHREGWFHEGVWNRELLAKVMFKLKGIQLPYYVVSHRWLDLPLQRRVDTAHRIGTHFDHCIFISIHANAHDGTARGFEVYTSPGLTKSDLLADMHYENVARLLRNDIRIRTDQSDGDYDKEDRFYVLTKTVMPAMLIEHLFFDNYEDAKLLMEEDIKERFAEALVHTILDYKAQL